MRVQVDTAAFGVDAVAVGTVAVDTTASARSMPEARQQVRLAAGRRQEVRFVIPMLLSCHPPSPS